MMMDTQAALLSTRAIVRVSGPEARDFLQGLISNDMAKVSPQRTMYAALLTPQGKVLFDFFVVESDGGFFLDTPADRAAEFVKRLALYRLRAKVEIEDVSTGFEVVTIWGDTSSLGLEPVAGAAGMEGQSVCFVDPRLAVLGVRVILPRGTSEAFCKATSALAAPESAYEAYRLALGVPDSTRDMAPDSVFLLEADFEELNGVDFQKGCYIGQEQTSRMKRRATARKRLVPVRVDGPMPAEGAPIKAGGREIGRLCSGSDARGIALVRLKRVGDALALGQPLSCEEAVLTPENPEWAGFDFSSDSENDAAIS